MEAVDGTLLGEFSDLDATFTAVDTDSRDIRPGGLFIPLQGERFDGHAFLHSSPVGGGGGLPHRPEPGTAMSRESFM